MIKIHLLINLYYTSLTNAYSSKPIEFEMYKTETMVLKCYIKYEIYTSIKFTVEDL